MNKETALEYLKDHRWQRASNYMGMDWSAYFVIVSKNRDSDCLEKVNFETARKLLSKWEGEEATPCKPDDETPTLQVTVASANHWAVGWTESLMIHEEASEEALIEAAEIICSLADYPCLDESAWAAEQYEDARETWDRYLGDRQKVRLAKQLGIKTPGLAARWRFEIINWKTEGRILELMGV
jgi:hypothetical protein